MNKRVATIQFRDQTPTTNIIFQNRISSSLTIHIEYAILIPFCVRRTITTTTTTKTTTAKEEQICNFCLDRTHLIMLSQRHQNYQIFNNKKKHCDSIVMCGFLYFQIHILHITKHLYKY